MSTTSSRTIQLQFSGDETLNFIGSALDNINSPGQTTIISLASGANTITVPLIPGVIVVTGLTIIPPAGNTSLMTLKGVAGDTGIALHKTDPTSIGLDLAFTSLVINAAAKIDGVRLIWS